MSTVHEEATSVPQEELDRMIAEHRRLGFERQAMPHILYSESQHACPWPGCGFQIVGIDFRLEKDPPSYPHYLRAWWLGSGLAGRCPGCGNYVLFTMDGKQAVADAAAAGLAVLPDDWHQRANII